MSRPAPTPSHAVTPSPLGVESAGDAARQIASRRRRRTYLINPVVQRRIMHQVLRIVTAGIVLGGLNVLIIDYYAGFLTDTFGAVVDATNTVLFATAAYLALWLGLSYITLHIYLLVFSHRIVGPELKLRQYLDGLRNGMLDSSVKLRKKDFLQDLARDANLTASHFRELHGELSVRLEEVRAAVDAGEAPEQVVERIEAMEQTLQSMRSAPVRL